MTKPPKLMTLTEFLRELAKLRSRGWRIRKTPGGVFSSAIRDRYGCCPLDAMARVKRWKDNYGFPVAFDWFAIMNAADRENRTKLRRALLKAVGITK